ncbi:uncharacterized protein BCR38DRAFT_459064 [Pseudomassariella vexata]|uniref:Protein kinase domain-containing protein n=1 Tax=Pseudomassariella vexata TaxID=1141098 RepID=A0A1Y2DTX5_9PEZI|nr:uncharacterized protein BCR38DRAFT_459064 [Pseudomassariella vexata]ORY62604.1 hypothetical protein BCR38DRAFT_459064 [Pseudomassariella vexata]
MARLSIRLRKLSNVHHGSSEKAEEQTRRTTLDEYIAATHDLVFIHLTVETDKKLTSTGSTTHPRNKLCPTHLRPWTDFLEQYQIILGKLYATPFPLPTGSLILSFLHNSVEDPVREIFDQLRGVDKVRREFQVGDGIIFKNRLNTINDIDKEGIQRQAPSTPDQGRSSGQIRPDQICVYRADDGPSSKRTMLYVTEYKAPHKLIAPHLRAGLHPMNIFKDVVNRKTIPTAADPEARFQYHAERLAAAALSQTYDYMIKGGLEYGVLTTGEAIVFLKMDWDTPETLFYHLAEPVPEVPARRSHPAEPGPEFAARLTDGRFYTAVCQYLAFSLMAIGPPGKALQARLQEGRRRAILGLIRWVQDFETTLRSIPPNERIPPTHSSYAPTIHLSVSRSPVLLPKKARRKSVEDVHPGNQSKRNSSNDESSDEESPLRMPDSPSPSEPRSCGHAPGVRRSEWILAQRPRGGGEQGRQYYTQKCLLGLVRNGRLDKDCPNITLHRQGVPQGLRHPINHKEFLRLLYEQLKKSLDDGVIQLYLEGSRGVLFQVTLLAYGYTFVRKATVTAFIPDFQHEERVYQLLDQEQGVNVPVFLGTVDLREMDKIYYYAHRRCLGAIHQAGVVHGDVRRANVLRDAQTRRVMIIDFERSIIKPVRRPLDQVVPNKRVWTREENGGGGKERSRGQHQSRIGFHDDILAVDIEFSR